MSDLTPIGLAADRKIRAPRLTIVNRQSEIGRPFPPFLPLSLAEALPREREETGFFGTAYLGICP